MIEKPDLSASVVIEELFVELLERGPAGGRIRVQPADMGGGPAAVTVHDRERPAQSVPVEIQCMEQVHLGPDASRLCPGQVRHHPRHFADPELEPDVEQGPWTIGRT